MHYVFDYELENLGTATADASVNLALFGIAFGAALSLWITYLTVSFTNPITENLIITIAIMLSLLSVSFGAKCYLDTRKAKRQLAAIREDREDVIETEIIN